MIARVCPKPRCPRLQPCPDHQRKPFANARRSTSLYGTERWKRESSAHLLREPNCGACAATGVMTLATVVDHIVPHRGDEALFWDETNWASLCRPHHNAKTGRETRERGRGSKN